MTCKARTSSNPWWHWGRAPRLWICFWSPMCRRDWSSCCWTVRLAPTSVCRSSTPCSHQHDRECKPFPFFRSKTRGTFSCSDSWSISRVFPLRSEICSMEYLAGLIGCRQVCPHPHPFCQIRSESFLRHKYCRIWFPQSSNDDFLKLLPCKQRKIYLRFQAFSKEGSTQRAL